MTLHEVQEASYRVADAALRGSWPAEHAMDAGTLSAFLDERRYCVLATATAKGRPQARPVAYTAAEDAIWFATVAGGRLRNLERTPWISVVIADGDLDEHRAVAVDGPITFVTEPPPELLECWEQRFGSRAEWAQAWFMLCPARLYSYAASR